MNPTWRKVYLWPHERRLEPIAPIKITPPEHFDGITLLVGSKEQGEAIKDAIVRYTQERYPELITPTQTPESSHEQTPPTP